MDYEVPGSFGELYLPFVLWYDSVSEGAGHNPQVFSVVRERMWPQRWLGSVSRDVVRTANHYKNPHYVDL